MTRITHFLRNIDDYLFLHARSMLMLIVLATAFMASHIPALRMYSNFADLLPQKHPYIKLHNEIRDIFGGANVVTLALEVEEGTIFTNETLRAIHELTQAVDLLPGVNHNLVTSLTHRTARKVWLNEYGNINSQPYYDPNKTYSVKELEAMKRDVVANPRIYGLLVSPDLKAALIKAQLNEGALDYEKVFQQIQAARKAIARAGLKVYATGQPVLVGWVYSYLPQIFQIFLYTIVIMLLLLVVHFRNFYGVAIPLIGITLSGAWGLGVVSLLGYNLDPLTLVIPFLISARALSHGVQIVERYYAELSECDDSKLAARRAFDALFRPGSVGVLSDAIGIFLIALGSIPLNTKLAYYASIWSLSVIATVLITVPLLLYLLPKPKVIVRHENALSRLLAAYGGFVARRGVSVAMLAGLAGALVIGGVWSARVEIGESEPGSPLLYPDHDYNVSSRIINAHFPGSEELYVVAQAEEKGGLKRPEVLDAIERLEHHMLTDPAVGGAKGLPDLIKQVNRLLHNNDPRWLQIPLDPAYSGGLMFAYMASSPIPGALNEFINPDETKANLVFYYKDHRGSTIRRAIHMLKTWISAPQNKVEGLQFRLAGGIVGVTAASNEASYATNMKVIPLVLVLIFAAVMFFYWSVHAGVMMLFSMAFATTLTYAYMGWQNIGINVNTVPIIAVGIGVGIDYSIYMMDRIREEMARLHDLFQAVRRAVATTGLAICFTALTLISGVIMWALLSDLRFQADAALLLIVMLVLNAAAALILVPSWVICCRPKFITHAHPDPEGVIVAD